MTYLPPAGLYHSVSYEQHEYETGLLFLRMGSARLAHIAHRTLGLPGVSTLRAHSKMIQLLPSVGQVMPDEIRANLISCFSELAVGLETAGVQQSILMLDEIACEKRIRWHHKMNMFLGMCREHGDLVNKEFGDESDMVELFKAVDEGHVHVSSEV